MNDAIIKISELKRNTRILLETEETVFEIVVIGPKGCSVTVLGGSRFLRQTKSMLRGPVDGEKETLFSVQIHTGGKSPCWIEKDKCVQFLYEQNKSERTLTTSKVISATVFASDNSWKYDAIEKK